MFVVVVAVVKVVTTGFLLIVVALVVVVDGVEVFLVVIAAWFLLVFAEKLDAVAGVHVATLVALTALVAVAVAVAVAALHVGALHQQGQVQVGDGNHALLGERINEIFKKVLFCGVLIHGVTSCIPSYSSSSLKSTFLRSIDFSSYFSCLLPPFIHEPLIPQYNSPAC